MIHPFVTVDPGELFSLVMGWKQEEPESLKIIVFTISEGFKELKAINFNRPPLSQHLVAVATCDTKSKNVEEDAKEKVQKPRGSKNERVVAGYGFGKRAK